MPSTQGPARGSPRHPPRSPRPLRRARQPQPVRRSSFSCSDLAVDAQLGHRPRVQPRDADLLAADHALAVLAVLDLEQRRRRSWRAAPARARAGGPGTGGSSPTTRCPSRRGSRRDRRGCRPRTPSWHSPAAGRAAPSGASGSARGPACSTPVLRSPEVPRSSSRPQPESSCFFASGARAESG